MIRDDLMIDEARSGELLREILDSIADPVFVKDSQHRWIVLNSAYCEFVGHDREELLGKTDFDFFPQEEAEVFWQKDDEVLASGVPNENEERCTDANGRQHVIRTKKARFRCPVSGEHLIVGVIRDVTRIKQTEHDLSQALETLNRLSQTDELTGLSNRRGFLTFGAKQLAYADRRELGVVLAFADVDRLKKINDTHGHQVGDAVLISAADALRSALRSSDLIGRVSGDEFTALAIDAGERDTETLRDRIRAAIDDRNRRKLLPVDVALSIGVVYRPPRSDLSLTDLMDLADRSMYQDKRGRGSNGSSGESSEG